MLEHIPIDSHSGVVQTILVGSPKYKESSESRDMFELGFQWGPPILGHTDIPPNMGIVIENPSSQQTESKSSTNEHV